MAKRIGEIIKELRMSKNMTLEELGNKIGVGKSTVRKWETGMIANMRRDKIQKIADALEVSPGYLMGWTDEYGNPVTNNELRDPNTAESIAEILTDVELLTHVKMLVELSEKRRSDIYDQIQYWYDKENID